MVVDTALICEGHSTIRQFSDLETVKSDLPPFSDKVECRIEINRTGTTILMRIFFKGKFELECARCLEKYQHVISGDIRLILRSGEGGYGIVEEGENTQVYFDSKHSIIDLSPFIYDEIMTSLPLKPLCSDSCGGVFFNSRDEIVSDRKNKMEQEIDPRWESLRKLQKK